MKAVTGKSVNCFVAIAMLVLSLAACSGKDEKDVSLSSMIYSPNGEPLNGGGFGRPTCEKAMSGWLDRIYAANGGSLSLASYLSDAKIQFARMDIDHNGYIVSEELDRFREPFRQSSATATTPARDSAGHKGKHGHAAANSKTDSSLNMADPVMSADRNLDFKVTPEEFLLHAQEVFARLDTSHNGLLERAEVLILCDPVK